MVNQADLDSWFAALFVGAGRRKKELADLVSL
jgi:hypothetical protein